LIEKSFRISVGVWPYGNLLDSTDSNSIDSGNLDVSSVSPV